MQFVRGSLHEAAEEAPLIVDSTPKELDAGVVLERRTAIRWGLGVLASLFLPNGYTALGQDKRSNSNDRSEFDRVGSLIGCLRLDAYKLITCDNPDEEKYIKRAIRELTKLAKLEANPPWRHQVPKEQRIQAWLLPLVLVQFRMGPNSVIQLLDHRHQNGALSVREGCARVRSFDLFEEKGDKKWNVANGHIPGTNEEFLIQEKGDLILKAGQSAGLTRTRDNMHQIEAGPDGCVFYDLFTNFNTKARSYRIEWDGNYFDRNRKLCKVMWWSPEEERRKS